MVEKIQQFYKSVADARKKLSASMGTPFGGLAHDYPDFEWRVKSVKLSKDSVATSYSDFKLYDIVLVKKKKPNLKGHPFRGRD